jgi:hypothetical protein
MLIGEEDDGAPLLQPRLSNQTCFRSHLEAIREPIMDSQASADTKQHKNSVSFMVSRLLWVAEISPQARRKKRLTDETHIK